MRRVLQRHVTVLERPAQLCRRDGEGVGTEHRLVGVELNPTEQARVADDHPAAVVEEHAETVPRGIVAIARIDEPIEPGLPVEQELACHAETQPEAPALARSTQVEDQQLAMAAGAGEGHALHRGEQVPGRGLAPRVPAVTEHGALDGPAQRPLRQPAEGLDLG